jgi:ferredoxin
MNGYSIEIDRTLCSGFGACVEVAPHLIRLDDKG